MTAAATLAIAGCSSIQSPEVELVTAPDLARHIEIEVEDLDRGLPCSVVDRRTPDDREILWRAEFEADFCRQKAEETRLILQARGWACRPEGASERQSPSTRPSSPPFIIAAWRCLEGLQPIQRLTSNRPPVPAARPERSVRPVAPPNPETAWGNERLQTAVRRDLSAIGQDDIGDDTIVGAALGDLDSDGIEDAIVILTREAKSGAPHRMLMAYLQASDAYNLVDVWILKMPDAQGDGKLDLRIEDGAVHLDNCCEDPTGPSVLVLDERKLVYANDN